MIVLGSDRVWKQEWTLRMSMACSLILLLVAFASSSGDLGIQVATCLEMAENMFQVTDPSFVTKMLDAVQTGENAQTIVEKDLEHGFR
jgi:hypothetical protein